MNLCAYFIKKTKTSYLEHLIKTSSAYKYLTYSLISIRREKKHFNMVELLKAEEKKKKGGIGVAKTAKPKEEQQVKREREKVRHDKERKRLIGTEEILRQS